MVVRRQEAKKPKEAIMRAEEPLASLAFLFFRQAFFDKYFWYIFFLFSLFFF